MRLTIQQVNNLAVRYDSLNEQEAKQLYEWLLSNIRSQINKVKITLTREDKEDAEAECLRDCYKVLMSGRVVESPCAYLLRCIKTRLIKITDKIMLDYNRKRDMINMAEAVSHMTYTQKKLESIILITGKTGVGKTTMCRKLSRLTGYPYRSIDDMGKLSYDGRWRCMLNWIGKQTGIIIVECCTPHSRLLHILDELPHLIIELEAPEIVRRTRLKRRGDINMLHTPRTKTRMPDYKLPFDTPVDDVLEIIMAWE